MASEWPKSMTEFSIVTATFPGKDLAKKTARFLVEKRLAACAQIFPIESVYLWKGSICDESEVMLIAKSRTALFREVSAAIKEHHVYEVPEIVQIPITDGLPEYLQWIGDCTGQVANEKHNSCIASDCDWNLEP